MGYNIRSITGFFLPFCFEFLRLPGQFLHKTLDILQLSGVQVHPFQIGVFHMIYIINVKVRIDHISRVYLASSAFSLSSIRLAIRHIQSFLKVHPK